MSKAAKSLLVFIVFMATLCNANMVQKKVGHPSYSAILEITTIFPTSGKPTGGKISSASKLLAKPDVLGKIIQHYGTIRIFIKNILQSLMNVVGEWISQWVVNFFTGDLFKYYPFAPT